MTEVFAKELYDYYLTFNIDNPKLNLKKFNLFTSKLNISNKEELMNVPMINLRIDFLGREFTSCMNDIKFIIGQDKYKKIFLYGRKCKFLYELNNEQNYIYNYFTKLKKNIVLVGFREFIIDNNINNLEFFEDRDNIQNLVYNIKNNKDRSYILNVINIYYSTKKIKKIKNNKYLDSTNKEYFKAISIFIEKYNNFKNIITIINNYYKSRKLSKRTYDNYLWIIYYFNKIIFEKNINFHDIDLKLLIEFYNDRLCADNKKAGNTLFMLLNLLIENKFFCNIINKLTTFDINLSKTTIEDFNIDINIDESKRDYFNDSELDKIREESKKNIEHELIIILLSHYGFRIGGLRNIHINNIYDFEKKELKNIGKTLEKGNKIRYFNITLDFELANCLTIYLKEKPDIIHNKTYLFHSNYTDINISDVHMRKKIKNICEKAGIIGSHVHPHAFRKTVVINLMKLGNSIDTVSKFIGHSSSEITRNSYWVETQSDLTDNMIIPWIRTSNNVITLKDIGKLTKNINIEEASEKSGISKDFLYFIQDVYEPLKKKCSLFEERNYLLLSLLSDDSKKKYLEEEQNIIDRVNKKYENFEINKLKSNISSSLLESIVECDDND